MIPSRQILVPRVCFARSVRCEFFSSAVRECSSGVPSNARIALSVVDSTALDTIDLNIPFTDCRFAFNLSRAPCTTVPGVT